MRRLRDAVGGAGGGRLQPALALFCAAGLACATTEVIEADEAGAGAGLPRPDRVLVFDFASSPEDVALNRAIPARVARRIASGESEAKRTAGRRIAAVVANRLVDGFWKFDIPAEPADEKTPLRQNDLALTGQFVSIDEGNRVTRTAIGFGAGATEVRARVQLYRIRGEEADLLTGFHTIARSSRLPSVTTSVAGVTGDSIEADARRAADHILAEVLRFFVDQGWLSPDALK